MIDKKIILKKLIENLRNELVEVESAAKSTRDLVTADDLKSEGKYDTRAIEASYLASAQLKRVEEIKTDIQMLEEIELVNANKLQMGSLALIEYKGNERYYFLTSTSGGTMLTVDENTILVISVFSPLGNGALGLQAGESFEIETPKEMRTYKIINVY
ncbi:MAG: GreA/GreB family elongation factor [Bacteriovorax sp.]|nr:GreA/GreB family elongation factor [Bacteriovorax sp.]